MGFPCKTSSRREIYANTLSGQEKRAKNGLCKELSGKCPTKKLGSIFQRDLAFHFVRQEFSIQAAISKENLTLRSDMDMIGGLIILKDIEGNKHFFGVGDIMAISMNPKPKVAKK